MTNCYLVLSFSIDVTKHSYFVASHETNFHNLIDFWSIKQGPALYFF